MWDTVQTNTMHLSHDLPCPRCGHAAHTYLACGDTCDCASRPCRVVAPEPLAICPLGCTRIVTPITPTRGSSR